MAADGRIEPGDMLLQVSVSSLGGSIVRCPPCLEEDPRPSSPVISLPALFLR